VNTKNVVLRGTASVLVGYCVYTTVNQGIDTLQKRIRTRGWFRGRNTFIRVKALEKQIDLLMRNQDFIRSYYDTQFKIVGDRLDSLMGRIEEVGKIKMASPRVPKRIPLGVAGSPTSIKSGRFVP
jgi:hypothetical protein